MKPLGLHACFVLSAALCGLAFFLLILLSHKAWAGYAPEVQRGLAWLESRVQGDGSLSGEAGSVASPFQARSAAQETLHALAAAPAGLVAAIAAEPDDNTEYLARRISTQSRAGHDTVPQVAALTARQNPDGGFGGAEGLASNPLDTAWALLALKAAGGGNTVVPGALAYLQGLQAEDGAYGANGQSGIYVTAMVLAALRAHASNYPLSATTARAVSWLDSRRQADGGWEGSPWLTAAAYIALHDFIGLEPLAGQVRAFLTAAQAADGSWEGADPYATALVVRALVASWEAPLNPTRAVIKGKLMDGQTGLPLNGVSVYLTGPSNSTVATTLGHFEFEGLSPGVYNLEASLAEYGTITTQATLQPGQVLDLGTIPLTKNPSSASGTLRGSVRDYATGLPLAGATVVVMPVNLSASTDSDGNYQINNVTPGNVTITASLAGYAAASGEGTVNAGGMLIFSPLLHGSDTPAPPPDVNATGVSGVIVDAGTDLPLAGANVVLMVAGVGSFSQVSLADGSFQFSGTGGSTTVIEVELEGYETLYAQLYLQSGQVLDAGALRLRKPDAGELLPNLKIASISGADALTDPQTLQLTGEVAVTAENAGTASSVVDVRVLAYHDVNGNGAFDNGVDNVLGQTQLGNLDPGQGTSVRIGVSGLLPFRDAPIHVWLDSGQGLVETDEADNLASTAHETSCISPAVLLSENFNDGNADGWQPLPYGGTPAQVIDGEYVRASYGSSWIGDPTWSNYTAEIKLRFPNGMANDAGLVFLVKDTSNWYGVSINGGLIRLGGPTVGVIRSTYLSLPNDPDYWHRIKAEILGQTLKIHLNGDLLFEVEHLAWTHGAVGTIQDGVVAHYDDLLVTEPSRPADVSLSFLRMVDGGSPEGATLTTRVGNAGSVSLPANTRIAFYDRVPEEGGTPLGSWALPHTLAPGQWVDAVLLLPGGLGGISEVVAIADPADELPECDKTNNRIALAVTTENLTPSFVTTLATDRGSYPAHMPVLITAHVLNTGSLAGVVKARFAIETADGVLVANLDPAGPVTVSAGALAPLGVSWGTGSHYTGRYAVKATFLDAADRDIGQERVLFDIEASCSGAACAADQIGATVRTDKGIYQPYDVVRISGRVSNPAQNQVLEGLSAVTRVIGPDGALIWSRATPIPQLVAGGARALAHDVPLIRAEPGSYRVTLEALDTQGQTLTQANQPFSVQSSAISGAGLAGHLHADPVQVAVGDPVVISASVVNNGNADIASLPVTLSVLDPESETVLAQWTEPTNLTQGQARTWLRDWTAQGTVDRVFVAALSAELAGTNITLAQTNIRLVDSPVRIELDAKFDPATRLLSLIACPPGALDPVACASERKQWLDAYLAEGSLPHRGTTTTAEFSRELRCGRYNVHWASGSSHMLDWRGTTELGAAERLGRGLLVDGVHEPRNTTLDALAGVSFVAPMAGSDHLVELQAPGFAPLTLTAPGMALAFDLIGSSAVAVFPEAGGVPAIVAHQHGTGHGALAAFDLPAALATGVWDAPFTDIVNMATPVAADVRAGGTWVPVSLDLTNQGQPIVIEVSALLSADLRLDGVPEGATLDALGQPVWSLALGAGEHRALRMAVWMPGSSGALSIPFLVSTVQGGTTQPYAAVSLDLQVAAMDLHGPQLLAAIQALAPDSPEEQAALDAASTALADALVRFADGRLVNALEAFLAADVLLSRIGSVPVDPLRADLARLIAQAQAAVCNAPPQPCDVDGDVDVDVSDTSLISRARGQSASPGDPRDANGDGLISPADVKACIPKCTRSNCAI